MLAHENVCVSGVVSDLSQARQHLGAALSQLEEFELYNADINQNPDAVWMVLTVQKLIATIDQAQAVGLASTSRQ